MYLNEGEPHVVERITAAWPLLLLVAPLFLVRSREYVRVAATPSLPRRIRKCTGRMLHSRSSFVFSFVSGPPGQSSNLVGV